jgi:hypothetical protein
MYFSMFPKTYYSFDNVSASLITDFMARVSVSESTRSNALLYDPYIIVDGDTPEIVADKVYKNPMLHWIILLTNEIIDPRYDWCLSQEHLVRFCANKYDNPYATHHFEDVDGYNVDSTYPGALPVSNYAYEEQINESKRVIKILNPSLIKEFINEFDTAISNK